MSSIAVPSTTPGKFERYNNVTGLDEPVIRFLEEDGEIVTFLETLYPHRPACEALYGT